MTVIDQLFLSKTDGIPSGTPVGSDEGVFYQGGILKRGALSSFPGGGGGASPILPWGFDSTTTDADPGAGNFRLDNAVLANVTFIYINKTADNGIDGSELIEALRNGDEVYIQQEDDETKAALFTVTGEAIDATTYYKIPVDYKDEGSGGLFTNGTNCSFMYHYNSNTSMNPLSAPVKYNRPTNQQINSATPTVVDYNVSVYDDDNLVTTGAAWEYAAPTDQKIHLHASVLLDQVAWTDGEALSMEVQRYRSGSWTIVGYLDRYEIEAPETTYTGGRGGFDIDLAAGEKVRVVIYQDSGLSINLIASDDYNYITIHEIPTRLSTAAPPTYHAYADSDAGQSLTADVTDIIMEDIEADANNMINIANGRITPPVKSRVRIIINIDPSGVGTPLLKLYKTGVFLRKGQRNTGGESTTAVFEEIVDPATDYLTIRNGFAATLDGVAANNWIRVEAEPT